MNKIFRWQIDTEYGLNETNILSPTCTISLIRSGRTGDGSSKLCLRSLTNPLSLTRSTGWISSAVAAKLSTDFDSGLSNPGATLPTRFLESSLKLHSFSLLWTSPDRPGPARPGRGGGGYWARPLARQGEDALPHTAAAHQHVGHPGHGADRLAAPLPPLSCLQAASILSYYVLTYS